MSERNEGNRMLEMLVLLESARVKVRPQEPLGSVEANEKTMKLAALMGVKVRENTSMLDGYIMMLDPEDYLVGVIGPYPDGREAADMLRYIQASKPSAILFMAFSAGWTARRDYQTTSSVTRPNRAPPPADETEAMLEIIGHLGAALIQTVPSDDQIIMGHVKSAHDLACQLRRRLAK